MRFSHRIQSFNQSQPSPSGTYIASIAASKLSVLEISSLKIINEVPLQSEHVTWFVWSPTSNRILIGSNEVLYIYSAKKGPRDFSVIIKNVAGSFSRASLVSFGANDSEVLILHDFGLKLSIFNLITSQWVDIVSPKLYSPRSTSRGFSYRPSTANLTLLSRNSSRDIVSIHSRDTLDVIRSWRLDTIDAQGMSWSPDGKWLFIYESATLGYKIVVYTADGQLYQTWQGPTTTSEVDDFSMIGLGLGIKFILCSPDSTCLAVSDYSAIVMVIQILSFSQIMSLEHSIIVKPNEENPCLVWQEQAELSQPKYCHKFTQAVTDTFLPSLVATNNLDEVVKTGMNLMSFNRSGMFLATTTVECSSTMWIWDMKKQEPRAIIILYRTITKIIWHPTMDGYVMVRCEGDAARNLVYLWHPSWVAPQGINLSPHLVCEETMGKTVSQWIYDESSLQPIIFYSDSRDCLLVSILSSFGAEGKNAEENGYVVTNINAKIEKNKMKSKGEKWYDKYDDDENEKEEGETSSEVEDSEILDDTFYFRKQSQPSRTS